MRREKKIPLGLQESLKGQHPSKEMKLSRKQFTGSARLPDGTFL